MEWVGLELNGGELVVGDLDAGRVAGGVERGLDTQTGGRGGVGDQIDDHLVAGQRAAAPVERNLAEHSMLDLVPLAGAGRKMKDMKFYTAVVR